MTSKKQILYRMGELKKQLEELEKDINEHYSQETKSKLTWNDNSDSSPDNKFNLSDMQCRPLSLKNKPIYREEDIKQFIKQIKEKALILNDRNYFNQPFSAVKLTDIINLAGENLSQETKSEVLVEKQGLFDTDSSPDKNKSIDEIISTFRNVLCKHPNLFNDRKKDCREQEHNYYAEEKVKDGITHVKIKERKGCGKDINKYSDYWFICGEENFGVILLCEDCRNKILRNKNYKNKEIKKDIIISDAFSDLSASILENGWTNLIQYDGIDEIRITLGNYPNKRFDIIEQMLRKVKERKQT